MSIEIDLCVVHHFAGGVYAKQMVLPANHYAVKHSHDYDHLSYMASDPASYLWPRTKRTVTKRLGLVSITMKNDF